MTIVKFKRHIRMSGRSAAVSIPPELLDALGLKIGDAVELFIEDEKLVLKRS